MDIQGALEQTCHSNTLNLYLQIVPLNIFAKHNVMFLPIKAGILFFSLCIQIFLVVLQILSLSVETDLV